MEWKDSNITLPLPKRNELTSLIEQNGVRMEVPAKKVFLKPGDTLNGVYYIAEGRTLSAGWFYGETPCVLHDSTGLFSKTEKPSVLYLIPMQNYDRLLAESSLFREAILQSYSQKMRILRQEIANLSFTPCKDRLRRLYCSTADTSRVIDGQWYDLKLNYTQYEISTIVGGARVTITKLINELCAEGFIRVLNRKTQINIEQYKQEIEKDWA